MFCTKCGSQLEEGNHFCPKCGTTISQDNIANPSTSDNNIKYQEPGRGTIILILGILSIVLLGPFVGIPAWVMGNKDLKKIKNGIISLSEKSNTKVGMILGIIGTFISFFTIMIIGIAVVVGINVMTASSQQANRDALIADCTNLASLAQQYYRKPLALGGGGNDFTGWSIPSSLEITANGEYSIEYLESGSLSIVGVGNELGEDDDNNIKVIMRVTPNEISTEIIN